MRAIKNGSINCTAEAAVSVDGGSQSRTSASASSAAGLEVDEDRDRGSGVASVDTRTDSRPSIRDPGVILLTPQIKHVSPSLPSLLLPSSTSSAIDPTSRVPATTSHRRQLDFPSDTDVTAEEFRPSESWNSRDLPARVDSDVELLSKTWEDDMLSSTMTTSSESTTTTSQTPHTKRSRKRKKKRKGRNRGRQEEGRESASHEDQDRKREQEDTSQS